MLIEDARRPYREIAEEVGLSESTVRKRVVKMQEAGVIEKFTIKIRQEEKSRIYAFFTIIPKSDNEVKSLLREAQILPQCEEVYKLDGRCGILIKVNVPDIIELDALAESFRARDDVDNIEQICVVLKPVKSASKNGVMFLKI